MIVQDVSDFPSTVTALRGIRLTAKRAGWRRNYHRLRRFIRLHMVDPLLAGRLYPIKRIEYPETLNIEQHQVLRCLVDLRQEALRDQRWDRSENILVLLNQEPVSLSQPVAWYQSPIDDPLWAFRLHSWDWAWPALAEPGSRQLFLDLWNGWLDNVPAGKGLAWEPYPTSRRLVVWCAAWHLLAGDSKKLGAIVQHVEYLKDHLEHDLGNNHLIANAKALAWVGLLFPSLQKAEQWRKLGLSLLWDALRAQVRGDGGHVENSTSYHLTVWLDGLETALLCQASGQSVPKEIWQILEQMGEFALALLRPDFSLPLLNDSVMDEPLPVKAMFRFASKRFDRSDFAWASGEEGRMPPNCKSKILADSGYATLRFGYDPEDTYLLFDFGELGPPHCPGHGHADTLGIELWAKGQPLVVDPGTYQYPLGKWRDYFRSTAVHSTATVDDRNQSVFVGPFRVSDLAHGELLSAKHDREYTEIVAQHDGYTRLPDPVMHRRMVRMLHQGHVEIHDEFLAQEHHKIVVRFHLASNFVTLDHESNEALAVYSEGVRLRIRFESEVVGSISAQNAWISRTWYQKVPSTIVSYRCEARLPVGIMSLLWVV